MNILVTGGAGFIGSHLCDALLALGHRVSVVDNFITGSRDNIAHLVLNKSFVLVTHDIVEPLPETSLTPLNAIFHLASPASPVGYGKHPLETLNTNALGTQRVLELAKRDGAQFLLASTSEVYGDPKIHPQTEDYWGNVDPVGPRSCYDEGKRYAEALTVNYARVHDMDVRIVRIFNTYGPRNQPEDGRVIPNFLTQAIKGEPLTVYGDGEQTRSFCYVSDLVAGMIQAMFIPGARGEVINLGNPGEFSMNQLAERVKALTETSSPIVRMGARPQEIARRKPNIDKAKRLLNWQPTISLDEGIVQTVSWLREALALETAPQGQRSP